MPVAVSGSIATDHLMHFPGRFAEQLVAEQLHRISLSFLVDDLVVRRGGIGANIAFGMGVLGSSPVLVGRRRRGLRRTTVPGSSGTGSTAPGCTSPRSRTPPGSCAPPTTTCARSLRSTRAPWPRHATSSCCRCREGRRLRPGADQPGRPGRHAAPRRRSAAQRGYAFAADPSQQLARMSGEQIRTFVDRRQVPVQQRLRVGAAAAEDRLDRAGRARPGRHADHHAR